MKIKEPYEVERIVIATEIRKFFLTNGNKWISEKEMRGRNRLWQVVFNDLIKQGFIEIKKELPFDHFRWKENWKEEEIKPDYLG